MLLAAVLLAAAPPLPEIAARAAELSARAHAHHEAGEFVQAASTYVSLSSLPGVDVDDALGRAHVELEAAFGASREALHLCRALHLARGRLARGNGSDDRERQRRLFWEETVAEDLELLEEVGGEARCPTSAPRVGLLVADTLPREETPSSPPEVAATPMVDGALRPMERRLRARRAAGLTLTGVGVGLAGLTAATLAGYLKGYAAIEAAGDRPVGFVYSGDEEAALRRLRGDAELFRGLAAGLGVASVATLATGIGLLASQRRVARRFALFPSSLPRGGGLVLRLRF